ncbi:MAG: methyltransferase domain-containing protein [Anaerolineales bacterium]
MEDLKPLFEQGKWYHCFRHQGLVSNGTYNIENYISYYGFEQGYEGKSVLDVGSSDGYFSIWMKEHGATRVCAVDSNKYDGSLAIQASNFNVKNYEDKYAQYVDDYTKFQQVYEKLGLINSNKLLLMAKLKSLEIEFQTGTIYDLEPYGEFDIVMCNDLLEHLRDPITAIEQLYFVTREKCIITVSSAMKTNWFNRHQALLTYQGHMSGGSFYSLSEGSAMAMCKAAGFKDVRVVSRFDMENLMHHVANPHFVLHAYK